MVLNFENLIPIYINIYFMRKMLSYKLTLLLLKSTNDIDTILSNLRTILIFMSYHASVL